MSAREIDRGELIRRVREKQLTQAKAAALMGLSVRQVKRLCRLFKDAGLSGLASRRRGRPSNRKLASDVKDQVVALVRERYADFGPKLAHEKLVELHGIRVGRETVRKWLTEAGIWLTRAARALRAHQPRHRRQCLGELVQIDGCDHEWFEQRADRCTVLVYVDDATGRLMELRFVKTESAFDYFDSTVSYLGRHGNPDPRCWPEDAGGHRRAGRLRPVVPPPGVDSTQGGGVAGYPLKRMQASTSAGQSMIAKPPAPS